MRHIGLLLCALFITILFSSSAVAEMELLQTQPHIPEALLEKKVIGVDDRVSVGDVRQYPYSAIALLQVKKDCGCTDSGTGFMVDRDVMMTAAHCMICTKHGGKATDLTAYFGFKSKKNYLYKYDGPTQYWTGTTFKKSDGTYGYVSPFTEDDYAYLKLEKDVGSKTGWFGLSPRSDAQMQDYEYEVAGYRDGLLKYDRGYVEIRSEKELKYQLDAVAGNSGCPVFDWNYYVVGIHVSESRNYEYNNARRITGDLMEEMRRNVGLDGL